jgi:hypothetical protein
MRSFNRAHFSVQISMQRLPQQQNALVAAQPNRLPDRGRTVLLIESIFVFL